MQVRQKWRGENLSVGDVVLIIDPLQVRARWPVVKVIEVLPGEDGRGRAVKVQTDDRVLTRPVARLIKLPVVPDEHTEVPMNDVKEK